MCYNSAAITTAEETRSLWEQLDSEVEPWRRGRFALVLIALLNVALQGVDVALHVILGDIERVLIIAGVFALFWLQFYFIWIGVHWIRWLAGAWSALTGFCFVIWAVRDNNPVFGLFGAINLIVAGYLCLSSSVYFFAKRQHESVRWKDALGVAAVCFLVLGSIGAAMLGVWGFRIQQLREALEFGNVAADHIYVDSDFDWALSRITHTSLQRGGRQRLDSFFEDKKRRLGAVRQISEPRGTLRVRYRFPVDFEWSVHVISHAESDDGPANLHFILSKTTRDWQIDHIWWEYLPLP